MTVDVTVEKMRSKGQRLRPHGYEKGDGRTFLVTCAAAAAAAAGVELQVRRTARVSRAESECNSQWGC